jgi:hypothetical protein
MPDEPNSSDKPEDPLALRAYRNPRLYMTKAELDGHPPGEHVLGTLPGGHVQSPLQAPVDPAAAGIHVVSVTPAEAAFLPGTTPVVSDAPPADPPRPEPPKA